MRTLPRWAALACLAAWAVATPEARAFHGHGRAETVYVAPTETVLAEPTTYVSATSYAVPTAYVSPTVYTGSSYVPTTYYLSPTAYVVPSYRATSYLAPRRYVQRPIITTSRYYDYGLSPTTYYYTPTAYYSPTALDLPVASSLSSPCETTTGGSTSISSGVTQAPKAPAAPAAPAASEPRTAPRPIVSTPKAEEPRLQTETRAVPEEKDMAPPAEPAPPKPEDSPTPPPVPANVPDVPFPEVPAPEGDAGASPRETMKPAAPSGGILEGRVVSGTTGQAEKGVKVVVTHRRAPTAFVDREVTTDALGRYAIDVPPGDWAVRVVRPNGKSYSVKNITVSGGRVSADDGQAVSSLVINL